MKAIRVKTVVDAAGNIRIPAPADLHPGDTVDLEAIFHDAVEEELKRLSWLELIDRVAGCFEDHPLELPADPPPEPLDFEQ